jgi:hypothetical protein
MRSNMITVAAVVAGIFLAAPMATAADVQEQLRLMEQRMAEMEDRLQATSDELNTAKTTVEEQQDLLTDAGLAADDRGIRSGVGKFLKEVDISGVAAASYNYRFLGPDDDVSNGGNVGYFRHPDSNTFALDQLWMVIDKAVTEESRAGFHAEYVYGKTANSQGASGAFNSGDGDSQDYEQSGLLYTGYVSYLAPIGSGVQIDAGKLATVLGAEVLQTNQNFNVTTGLVFGLQPVTYTGVQASTALTDNLGLTVGVMNDVYTATSADLENDKAYLAQLQLSGDMFGLNVGAIVGNDRTLGCGDADDDCYTSVFDVLMTVDPTDSLSMWINFDWVKQFGERQTADGDAYGLAAAGRFAITEDTGFATRVEYVRTTASFNSGNTGPPGIGGGDSIPGSIGEVLSLTGTIDHALTDDLKLRLEARWDRQLDDNGGSFVNGNNGLANGSPPISTVNPNRDDQVVGLAEIYYEF